MNKKLGRLLCLVLLSLTLFSAMNAPTATAQPSQGDWIVTGVEVVENENIVLGGNLMVKGGGSLTLRNTTLKMNVQYDGQYGISVEPGASIFIYDSIITPPNPPTLRFTFRVQEATFLMEDSELHGCGWGELWGEWERENGGLLLQDVDNAVIEGNIFSGNFYALMLLGTDNSIIRGNTFSSNDESAICLTRANNNTISNNTFSSNLFGIQAIDSNRNTIASNTISDFHEGGVWLFNSCEGNTIENNIISAPIGPLGMPGWVGVGIGAEGSHVANNNVVINNSITGTKNGLAVTHSSGNLLENNSITDVGSGITLGYASRNTIVNNNLSNVGPGWEGNAIELFHSSRNIIMNNHISLTKQTYGIILSGSSCNNTLQCNVIQSSPQGIGVFNSSNSNEIVNNAVTLDGGYSVILNNSENNAVYGNNFINNGKQAYDNAKNCWCHNSKGNYWSDYKGKDEDNDSVGDVPYLIYPNGIDRYPSIEPLTLVHPPAPAPEPVPLPTFVGPGYSITENVVWKNGTREEGGMGFRIDIYDGGSLTLENFTLIMPYHASGIFVNPGGALYIYDSKIIPAENGGGFQFNVQEDAVFEMKNSELRGCGFCPNSSDWGGLYVLTSTATIKNNIITDSYHGLCGCGGIVMNNTISDCYSAGNLIISSLNTISNCVDGWGRGNFPKIPTQNIGLLGGFIRCGKAWLEVPENALSENTTVTIEAVWAAPPSGYSIVGSAYELGPTGTMFAVPATVTLSYDEADLQAGWTEEELSIWRKTDGNWEDLGGTVNTQANEVSVEVTSLSEYAILASPPTADAGGPYSVDEGGTVELDGTGSSDLNGAIVSYSWTITDDPTGGASLTNSGTATPTFHAPSVESDTSVTVSLTVTDDDGATDSDTATVTIHPVNESPVADFSYSPSSPTTADTIQFTDNSSDPDGSIASWSWDFGDGNISENENPTHSYADNGTYTVTLTVTDDDGATDSDTATVTVQPAPTETPYAIYAGVISIVIIVSLLAYLLIRR